MSTAAAPPTTSTTSAMLPISSITFNAETFPTKTSTFGTEAVLKPVCSALTV